ncbi:hypothetical protein GCM10027089_59190 [Nocardia thraciensis]
MQAGVVVPVASFHERELDLGEGAEQAVPAHDLGLEQSDDRFRESVVVGIPDRAYGQFDADWNLQGWGPFSAPPE